MSDYSKWDAAIARMTEALNAMTEIQEELRLVIEAQSKEIKRLEDELSSRA